MTLKNTIGRLFTGLVIYSALVTFYAFGVESVLATELPPDVIAYINKTFPGSNVRFDGVVELQDGGLYLPVIPVAYVDHDGPVRVSMTVPDKSLKPELIIFSNNLSLMKVITNERGEKTVLSGMQVPLKVKLGLLPQDLLVPEGLVVPSDMSSILGDLVIPSTSPKVPADIASQLKPKSNSELSDSSDGVNLEPLVPAGDVTPETRLPGMDTEKLFGLKDRMLYVSGITGNKIYVVDPQLSEVVDTIQVSALPMKAVLSKDKKLLYVICLAGNTIACVNIKTGEVENLIKVGLRPSCIDISPDGSKLFVTNSGSGNVSIINTELFEITNTISVQGLPDGIVSSKDNKSFYVFNRASGIVSKWDAINSEDRQFLFMIKNPCAIAINPDETKLFVTSRTQNNLLIYNLKDRKYDGVIEVGTKPIDIAVSLEGRYVYTLDAADDKISIVDSENQEVVGTIDLMTKGFPSSISIIPGTNMALITNVESDKITLVDLNTRKVLTTLTIGIKSKSLVIGPTKAEQIKAPKHPESNQEKPITIE